MASPGNRFAKKRLASGEVKTYVCPAGKRNPRKALECIFSTVEEKEAFEARLIETKKAMGVPAGNGWTSVINTLLDRFMGNNNPCQSTELRSCDDTSRLPDLEPMSSGGLLVCEPDCIGQLIKNVTKHSASCKQLLVQSHQAPHGHAFTLRFSCSAGHTISWNTSAKLGKEYAVNYRLVLAYLCSGMTPIQFQKFSEFAQLGHVSKRIYQYLIIVFSAAVELLRLESVTSAAYEEQRLSRSDSNQDGAIGIMSDARHACRKNSYHTDVVSIGLKTHKIVDIQHVTKMDEISTQKHESLGTEWMYKTMEKKGIRVAEHAHDRNLGVNKQVRKYGAQNSNDRWHVARSVSKAMMKISQGSKKQHGKVWHVELQDKRCAVRNHYYWSMENANGDADRLRRLLDTIPLHFQNIHDNCDPSSACREETYIPGIKTGILEVKYLLSRNLPTLGGLLDKYPDILLVKSQYPRPGLIMKNFSINSFISFNYLPADHHEKNQ